MVVAPEHVNGSAKKVEKAEAIVIKPLRFEVIDVRP